MTRIRLAGASPLAMLSVLMALADHLSLVCCPDCRGDLTSVLGSDAAAVVGLACRACERVFPVEEDIPILLPSTARNEALERPLVERLRAVAIDGQAWLLPCIEKTLALLGSFEGRRSWEWEDEEYWQEKYSRQARGTGEDRRPVRQWQREFLLEHLLASTQFAGKVVLDVGCGQGLSFRETFIPHCDASTLYIGSDIALEGLKLNRARNPHANKFYVLTSADRLPFRPDSIDILCYFGVLHHTERQEATIPHDAELVKPGGFVMLHEAIIRPWTLPETMAKQHQSEHEERLDGARLRGEIEADPKLEIVAFRESTTIVTAVARRVLRRVMRQRRGAWKAIDAAEQFLMKTVGRVVPLFQPGNLMLLARKR